MRLMDANPILFIIVAICIVSVACFEVLARQLGGSKAMLSLLTGSWSDLRPHLSFHMLWLLALPALLVGMLLIPGAR